MSHDGQPTQFPELNHLLADLTDTARSILGEDFVGAYLQGSFAVGDADLHSDCDFLIPVRRQVTAGQEAALRAVHDEIPTRPGHWTHHLEGSYPVAADLRSLDAIGRNWLYVDHGWRQMQWSTHCNNVVARWSLRECGVVLDGPDPHTLVDAVPADAVRNYARESAGTFMDDFSTWMSLDVAWGQRYAVTTFCRFLATLDTGRVISKQAALTWGRQRLSPEWSKLIEQVRRDRPRGYDESDLTPSDRIEQARAFASYAEARARSS